MKRDPWQIVYWLIIVACRESDWLGHLAGGS